ncbi:MAG TPA: hypothetical protein VNL17_14500 [Verrucomicrobiae bacterium]|nr:hypothetical protein [Verrucomicrobiae bacterium]
MLGMYNRSKRNGGFLSGPNHRLLGNDDQMSRAAAMQEPDQDDSGSGMALKDDDTDDQEHQGGGKDAAPNYRKADGMDDCGGCIHFDHSQGECKMYDFPTTADMVCDSYKPEGDEMNPAGGDGMTMPQANTVGSPPY